MENKMKKQKKLKENNLLDSKSFISEEGQKFYSVINTHKNFSEESFYKKFAKDIPELDKKEIQPSL